MFERGESLQWTETPDCLLDPCDQVSQELLDSFISWVEDNLSYLSTVLHAASAPRRDELGAASLSFDSTVEKETFSDIYSSSWSNQHLFVLISFMQNFTK